MKISYILVGYALVLMVVNFFKGNPSLEFTITVGFLCVCVCIEHLTSCIKLYARHHFGLDKNDL